MELLKSVFYFFHGLLWGDLFTIPLPGGNTMGVSTLVLLLIPAGIFFTIRLKFMPIRLFPEMIRVTLEKKTNSSNSLSGLQALVVSTATRVGMGNLMGVVAAVSAGGAGAVFWMWITAILIFHGLCRRGAGAAPQGKGSAVRRLSRRSCVLHPQFLH